jgi:enoyl-CoA hydratase
MPELVACQVADGIATVTLNRPERMNALNLPLWQGLGDVFLDLAGDRSVRAVVLRGAGTKAFAPGADIDEFETLRADAAQAMAYDKVMRRALEAVRSLPQPVVALIYGPCVGGGLELACCCDLRISARSGRFGVPIARIGVVMAHAELAQLVRVAGPAATAEILLEGRVFDSDEALAKGLVTRVVEDEAALDEAMATARRLAAGAPTAHRWHKRFLARLADPAPLRAEEIEEAYAFLSSDDYREGLAAFRAKRRPDFSGS